MATGDYVYSPFMFTNTTTTNGFYWNTVTSAATTTIQYSYTLQPMFVPNLTPIQWYPPVETAEQRAENARRDAEAIRERAEAKERARLLLKESLSDEQWADYEDHRSFRVISADGERTYRVRHGNSMNVDLLGPRNGVKRRYCLVLTDYRAPTEDQILAQKLLLEADEARFLQIAIAS